MRLAVAQLLRNGLTMAGAKVVMRFDGPAGYTLTVTTPGGRPELITSAARARALLHRTQQETTPSPDDDATA